MRKFFPRRRSLYGAVGVVTLALAGVVAGPALSASASPGTFTLCSQGGYDSWVDIPPVDFETGMATVIVPDGSCQTWPFDGGFENRKVDVYQAGGQYIGSTIYNGSVGETIVTIAGPSFYAYNG
jgi:hypothetical protein